MSYYVTTAPALILLTVLSVVESGKYRVCVIDGRGGFKKTSKYCPILDGPDSKVECIVGLNRMDCLRKISKSSADFAIFTPEDLVVAANSRVEMLITNEMRFTNSDYEYNVVAVINNAAGITNRYDLRGKRFCHPGYGYETDWTRILANFFENNVVPQRCNPSLTLTENRIEASSKYFKSACKAGPWVTDPDLDRELKSKYSNLCDLCDTPNQCSTRDKYWGRRGPLLCLTDGSGDISWARLDDVQSHFGITTRQGIASPDDYSFLCPDGTLKPVNSSNPCVWVVKPWPVITTRRTVAQEIQELVSSLSHQDPSSWQSALLDLIETYHINIVNVNPIEAIESYLDKARGYLSANSFTGCHPPRTIRICTTSNIENAKCGWLREAATVYGIEPNIDCLKADNKEHCLEATALDKVDVVMVSPEDVHKAERLYKLKTLFYETTPNSERYITIALTRKNDKIGNFADLYGKKACFPIFDGVAWNSVIRELKKSKLINSCSQQNEISEFFGESCVPNLPENYPSNLKTICNPLQSNADDFSALECLVSGKGDVAFVSNNSFNRFFKDFRTTKKFKVEKSDFEVLCYNKNTQDGCHLSWAPVGQAMVRANSSDLWLKDTLDVFFQMDNLFGKNHKSLTVPVTLFGLFDGKSNILFHDTTSALNSEPYVKNADNMSKSYREILVDVDNINADQCSSSSGFKAYFILIIVVTSFNYHSNL